MSDAIVLVALADALDAASAVLRERAAILSDDEPRHGALVGAVARARAIHPQLGPRQAEVIQLLEQVGPGGTSTGVISSSIRYDQPNVYLTLRGLITLGFVQKDEATRPHTYRLTNILLDQESWEQ